MNWILKKLKQGGMYAVIFAVYLAAVMILAGLVLLALISSARSAELDPDTAACVNEIVK